MFADAVIWKDKIWVMSDNKLFSIDLKTDKVDIIGKLELAHEGDESENSINITEDNLWIIEYTYSDSEYSPTGIARYNFNLNKLIEYEYPDIHPEIVAEVDNFLYISDEERLFKLDYEKNSIKEIELGVSIYDLEYIGGKLWVGTYNDGIYILDPADDEYTKLTENEGLPSNEIRNITLWEDNVLIDYGNYISKYVIETEEWIHYNLEELKRIHLLFDKEGQPWVWDSEYLRKVNDSSDLNDWYKIKLPTDENDENYIYSVNDILVLDNYILTASNRGVLYINMDTEEKNKVMKDMNIYKLISNNERVFAISDTGIYELKLQWENN